MFSDQSDKYVTRHIHYKKKSPDNTIYFRQYEYAFSLLIAVIFHFSCSHFSFHLASLKCALTY